MIKYKIMTNVYTNRTIILERTYNNPNLTSFKCHSIYSSVDISGLSGNITTDNFRKLSQSATTLEERNEAAIVWSCPLIY